MSPAPFDHLHSEIRHLATAGILARKACIQTDRWISYPAAEDALERIFELLDMPPRLRMPSLLFWASPNMGKTHIQKRFIELCIARDTGEAPKSLSKPEPYGSVLWLEVNDNLSEKRLYMDLLNAFRAPCQDTTASRLQAMVLKHFEARSIRMIILDELQRITDLRDRDQRAILNVLKYLSNQLQVSIVGFGSGETKALIKSDAHLEERFDIVALPTWTTKEKWLVNLVSERIEYLPLRKPTSVDRALMEALFLHSRSLLGRMFDLIERTAIAALEHDEQLSASLVEEVATRRRRKEDG
ncbi:TniB family NTP-binding protein [Caulobacter sp. Root487D2Y]|uniref:TniB family NTP-binding protein n=1 Tax=Caulobacter sp. Root487D2Y TaxID=1736547 RepID=UPI0009E8AC55|nr:TniB family NTP-binding protein [Caulobacter sp. Root487D2Y]